MEAFERKNMNETKLPNSLDNFMMCEDDGVFYIGHASALVRINKKLFLFDPVWGDYKPYGDYWKFFPSQINCDYILEKVEAVFISHIHEDHICEPILSKLRPEVPIHIKWGRPNLLKRLKNIHSNVMDWQPHLWQRTNDNFLTPQDYEFYFVRHAFNSIDSSVFIRSENYCVYVGSDNFLSRDNLKLISNDIGSVDVAMVPYAFVHWYPHLIANMSDEWKLEEIKRLNKQSLDQAEDFIKIFTPTEVIPFGNNLFYAQGLDHALNVSLVDPEELQEDPIRTGDFVLAKGIIYRRRIEEEFQPTEFPTIDPRPAILTESQANRLLEKLKKAKSINELHQLIINGVVIDLERPGFSAKYEAGIPSTEFHFGDRELHQWLDGEISFEQAIGTRRFYCVRRPNIYNLKVFEFFNNYL